MSTYTCINTLVTSAVVTTVVTGISTWTSRGDNAGTGEGEATDARDLQTITNIQGKQKGTWGYVMTTRNS